jgi:ABC-type uncharacterized transport system fused permease/ATPase subunit
MIGDIFNIFKPILTLRIKSYIYVSIALKVGIVCIIIYMTYWYADFWNSLIKLDKPKIIYLLFLYAIIKGIHIIIETITNYLLKIASIEIRSNLYNYYNIDVLDDSITLLSCQRMTQDLQKISSISIILFVEMIGNIISAPFFAFVLFDVANIYVALIALICAVFGSFFSEYISKPMVKIEYEQESMEGMLRRELVKVISTKPELRILPDMSNINNNYKVFAKRERMLSWFNYSYKEFSQFIPYVISVFMYLKSAISLGAIHQVVSSFTRLITSFSFLIDNRKSIIDLKTSVIRIKEMSSKKL